MSESQLDFTKPEDQVRFAALSEDEQELLVESAHDEASKLNEQRDVDAAIARIENTRDDDGRYEDPTVFDGLGSAVALKLIENGQGRVVVECLDRFKGLDRKEIALALLRRDSRALAQHLTLFSDVLDSQVADELIKQDQGWCVAKNPSLFNGLDDNYIIDRLLAHGDALALVRNLDNFKGINHKQLALKLIAAKDTSALVDDLSRFHNLDEELARYLVEDYRGVLVLRHLESFPGVSREHILELISKFDNSRH